MMDTLKYSYEVINRIPELPKIMDNANQVWAFLASGQIPQNTNPFSSFNDIKNEMKSIRNQSIIGLLVLVFLGVIVF